MGGESFGKYLTFDLAGQCFAVDASRVEVILEPIPITRVPKASDHLRGVINFRGAVIPVADMRTRFGEGHSPAGPGSSIIVLRLRYGPDEIMIGMLADAVREVIDLDAERIESPPRIGLRIDEAFVAGIARSGEEFIVLLDIDEAFKAGASTVERA